MGLSKETIEELRQIIHEDYGKELSDQETYEVATGLVGYFDLLAKLDSKDKEGSIELN